MLVNISVGNISGHSTNKPAEKGRQVGINTSRCNDYNPNHVAKSLSTNKPAEKGRQVGINTSRNMNDGIYFIQIKSQYE